MGVIYLNIGILIILIAMVSVALGGAGFTKEEDPVKVEKDLMRVLPKDHWILYNMQIITLGRQLCKAQKPKCEECFLTEVCPCYQKNAAQKSYRGNYQ